MVFIAPIKTRKLSRDCFMNSEPITAACPEPIPGRNEQRGADIIELTDALRKSFFGILIFFIFVISWRGIFVLFFKLIKIAEEPNNPVSNGRRGSFTGRLRVAKPKKPERMKIMSGWIGFFSLKVK